MKKLKTRLKVIVIVLFALVFVLGCKKEGETYSSEKEAAMIKKWVATKVKANNILDSTATGLHYIISKVGTGATVQSGDIVTLKYNGTFVDGSVFDYSESFKYVHKAAGYRMIPGFEDGIEKFSKGGTGIFLIPSDQAYGTSGYATIPPYTPLVFDIEIIDIK